MAASTSFPKNRSTYEKILKVITKTGNEEALEYDDLSFYESVGDIENNLDKYDWRLLCARELKAVAVCDVAIFDATDKATFGVGFLAAMTLQAQKPILLLLHEGSLEGSIITGLEDSLVTREYFTGENVEGIVTKFLESVGKFEANR